MKKTLLLLSLVSSLSSLAATSGWIETKQEVGNKLYSGFDAKKTNFETVIKGEIKVNDVNLKAGGEFKLKGDTTNYNINKGDSKIWAEYQLPDIQEVGSKIRVETKLDLEMKVQAEVFTTVEKVDYYAKAWYEGTKLFVTPKKAQGEVGFTHKGIEGFEYIGAKVFGGLTNISANKTDDYEVIAEAYGQYTGVKDFKLKFVGKGIYKHTKDAAKIKHGYELQVKATPEYSKNNVSFIAEDSEIFYNITDKFVKLVLKPEVKYTGIANTTLGTKVESLYEFETDKTKNWNVKPILFAEYRYMATDKLAIIPKGSIDLLVEKDKVNAKVFPTTVTPSIKLEYKPVSGVTFVAGAELPVTYNFKKDMAKTDIDVNAKGQLQVKYEW